MKEIMTDQDGAECIVEKRTNTSAQLFIPKKKKEGVNSLQWFTLKELEQRFM